MGNFQVEVNVSGTKEFEGLLNIISELVNDERVPLDVVEDIQVQLNELGLPKTDECISFKLEKSVNEKIRAIFAEEIKTSTENLVNACDGTADVTTEEAENSGEVAALYKIYKRINDEVLSK